MRCDAPALCCVLCTVYCPVIYLSLCPVSLPSVCVCSAVCNPPVFLVSLLHTISLFSFVVDLHKPLKVISFGGIHHPKVTHFAKLQAMIEKQKKATCNRTCAFVSVAPSASPLVAAVVDSVNIQPKTDCMDRSCKTSGAAMQVTAKGGEFPADVKEKERVCTQQKNKTSI